MLIVQQVVKLVLINMIIHVFLALIPITGFKKLDPLIPLESALANVMLNTMRDQSYVKSVIQAAIIVLDQLAINAFIVIQSAKSIIFSQFLDYIIMAFT